MRPVFPLLLLAGCTGAPPAPIPAPLPAPAPAKADPRGPDRSRDALRVGHETARRRLQETGLDFPKAGLNALRRGDGTYLVSGRGSSYGGIGARRWRVVLVPTGPDSFRVVSAGW